MKSDKSIVERLSKRRTGINRRELALRFKRMGLVNQKPTVQVQEIESRFHDCSIERKIKQSNRLHEEDSMEISEAPAERNQLEPSNSDPPSGLSSSSSSSSKLSGENSEENRGAVQETDLLAKNTEEEIRNDSSVSYGALSVIGRSRVMEDAVHVAPAFQKLEGNSYDFFGVYDGHGGARVAKACQNKLHLFLANELRRQKYVGAVNWTATMTSCFRKMDAEVACYRDDCDDISLKTIGSTAAVVVIGKDDIIVANCGDSRAVLCRAGVPIPLSRDHKPDLPDERKRIEESGGTVMNTDGCARVQGVLATSRSIGDYYLKPHVTAEPEVEVVKRTESDDFLIIATDGLWDAVTNDFACELVRRTLAGELKNPAPEDAGAMTATGVLLEVAMARGSRDNNSIIVVLLKKQPVERV